MTKATLILNIKRGLPTGAKIQIVVWQLPEPTKDRPHGYKYRFNYSLADGTTLIRYDNEVGKGDHKHIRSIEQAYKFTTIKRLFQDFNNDINNNGGMI